MIDSDEGLKDRDEVLEEMRSLFRYEDELLKGTGIRKRILWKK